MAYEIVPRVWFGPAGITWRPEEISKFTHIINCDSTRWSTNIWARDNRKFLHLWSDDDESFRILDTHFETLRSFVDDAMTEPVAGVDLRNIAIMPPMPIPSIDMFCQFCGEIINPAAVVIDPKPTQNEGCEIRSAT